MSTPWRNVGRAPGAGQLSNLSSSTTDRPSFFRVAEASPTVAALIRDAEAHIHAMLPATPSVVGESMTTAALARVTSGNVEVRLLHGRWASVGAWRQHEPTGERDERIQRRIVDDVCRPLLLIDRSVAFLARGGFTRDGLLVSEPLVVANLAAAFEQIWLVADVFVPQAVVPPRGATRDRAILRLMRAGASDASAARVMGVSIRTYHRHVADLMKRLGATTRFQAGSLAAERGWFRSSAAPSADRRSAGGSVEKPSGP